MSSQILFDQFAYADRLARGGFTPDQARASAEALGTALSEAVATKSDIAELKGELKGDIAELKAEIAAVKAEIAAVETRLDAKIDSKISGLEARFVSELHSTIYKGVAVLGGLIVIVSGAAAFVAKVLN